MPRKHAKNEGQTPAPKIPSYRLHKHSGRAVVSLNGVDHYLGARR